MTEEWQEEEQEQAEPDRGRGWFWLALVVMAAIAAVAVYRSALFRLQDVQVTGMKRLTEERVLEAAGLTKGAPRWANSAMAIRQRLLAEPWVGDATVQWQMGGVAINLKEREPVGLLRFTDRFYLLLDESGSVLEQTELGVYPGLPVVTGREFLKPLRGHGSSNEGLRDGLTLLARMTPAMRSQVSEVRVSEDRALTLFMVPGATVRWGLLPEGEKRLQLVTEKVQWFGGIWQDLKKRSGTCVVDLRVDGREAVSGCQ